MTHEHIKAALEAAAKVVEGKLYEHELGSPGDGPFTRMDRTRKEVVDQAAAAIRAIDPASIATEDDSAALREQIGALKAAFRVNFLRLKPSMTHADIDAVLDNIAPDDGWNHDMSAAPRDGRLCLVYRPLAELSGDKPIAVKRMIGGNSHCWPQTVPNGAEPCNPTDGLCHVTAWRHLPAPPRKKEVV